MSAPPTPTSPVRNPPAGASATGHEPPMRHRICDAILLRCTTYGLVDDAVVQLPTAAQFHERRGVPMIVRGAMDERVALWNTAQTECIAQVISTPEAWKAPTHSFYSSQVKVNHKVGRHHTGGESTRARRVSARSTNR